MPPRTYLEDTKYLLLVFERSPETTWRRRMPTSPVRHLYLYAPQEFGSGGHGRSCSRRPRGRSLELRFFPFADTAKGNRPSFSHAARPELAEPLYERFCAELRDLGVPVEQGVFGARMAVELVNDGPVTIVLEERASSVGGG